MHRQIAVIAIGLIAMVSGCAGMRDGALQQTVPGPKITSIKVTVSSLTPASGKQVSFADPDFVMLKVKVRNPEAVGASGVISCLRDGEQVRPLEHRFKVEPAMQSQYTVPVDELKPFSYTMHCRLEFSGEMGQGPRSPSPWIKIRVPSRS